MYRYLKLAVLLAAGAAFTGCAGIIELRLPPEFNGKKKIEDPPLTLIQPVSCAEQAG